MLAPLITDHVEQALSEFLTQYQGKARLTALMTALINQIQLLENAIYSLNAGRQLYQGNAVGAQLDGIGQLVGLPRNGLDDAEYLVFILGTIAENNSDSTVATLVSIVNTLFAPTLLLSYQFFPAAMGFAVGGSTLDPSLFSEAAAIIQKSLGGGIGLDMIQTCDPVNAFRYCSLTGTPARFAFPVTPSSGTYSLYFGGNSVSLNYNDSAATIQTAINALNGLTLVTVTGSYNSPSGFVIDWGTGAQVPISVNTNTMGVSISIFNSVVISPGTGGGYGDVNNPSAGGLFSETIYSNVAA